MGAVFPIDSIVTDEVTQRSYIINPSGGISLVKGLERDPLFRDMLWEEYLPRGVRLFNPRQGNYLFVQQTPRQMFGFDIWNVYPEEEQSTLLGECHILFQDQRIAISYVRVEEEFRGQGIARTVVQWLGLMAHREEKRLYSQDVAAVELVRNAHTLYPVGYQGYSTDYGITFDAPVDAEKVARHQRVDVLVSSLDGANSPGRNILPFSRIGCVQSFSPTELKEWLSLEWRKDDHYREDKIKEILSL